MGYNNDQFYRIGSAGENVTEIGTSRFDGQYNTSANNPGFAYPDRTVRIVDPSKSGTRNSEGGLGGRRSFHETAPLEGLDLKRGYIRSLATSVQGVEAPAAKCQFQFNPSTINQSVSQNPAFRSYLQEDPALYSVPTPGSSNFGFTLMFDRSMEMNNSDYAFNSRIDPSNPWELSDPGQVGVLRDIAAFNAAIGQGLSEGQKGYQQAVLERNLTVQSNLDEAPLGGSELSSALPTFLDMNIGNNAFLTPVPVRVVFSSLYIVDGFVQSTDVSFTKFNTSMVPMQCVLNVTMEAKYIGFAKKTTFLTDSLARQVEAFEQEQAEIAATRESVLTSLSTIRSVDFQVVPDRSPIPASPFFPRPPAGADPIVVGDNFEQAILDRINGDEPSRFQLYTTFPDVDPDSLRTSPDSGGAIAATVLSQQGPASPSLSTMFSTSSVRVTLDVTVDLYGPFRPASAASPQGYLAIAEENPDLVIWRGRLSGGVNISASTKEEMADMAAVAFGDGKSISRLSPDHLDDVTAQLYLVVGSATVSGTVNATPVTGSGTVLSMIPDLEVFEGSGRIPLLWDTVEVSQGSSTTVPPDNAATDTPSPGSPSSVGSPRVPI